MDADTPRRENDLSDVESRLSGWQPAGNGGGADAVLFAAGLTAGRRGRVRFLWPVLCGLLAVGCGAWALAERAERLALASRVTDNPTSPGPAPAGTLPDSPYAPSPDDYLHLRQRMEQDSAGWPASAPAAGQPAPEPPPGPPIFSVGQRDRLLEP